MIENDGQNSCQDHAQAENAKEKRNQEEGNQSSHGHGAKHPRPLNCCGAERRRGQKDRSSVGPKFGASRFNLDVDPDLWRFAFRTEGNAFFHGRIALVAGVFHEVSRY